MSLPISIPKKPLEGQIALVTGASRGIGYAISRKLANLGATLALCARDEGRLANVTREFECDGAGALAIPADLSRSADIARVVQTAERSLGPIDLLVNNAGLGYFGPAHEASEKTWDSLLDTNLKAVFLLSKAVAPEMIRRRRGQIINIASLAGKSAFAGGAIYCASKWGLLGLTQCMAEDLRSFGIRVSAICPGSVATDFSPHAGKDASKMLRPDDVAHAVGTLVTQDPGSFISEILLRPTRKP